MAKANITSAAEAVVEQKQRGQFVADIVDSSVSDQLELGLTAVDAKDERMPVGTQAGTLEVTADAPQAIEGEPVEATPLTIDDQMLEARAVSDLIDADAERVALSDQDVDRQNLYYPELSSRMDYGGWDTTGAAESDGEIDEGFRLRTKATVTAVRTGDYKFGMEKQTMEGNRVQGDKGFSTLTSVISNDHQAFDASNPDWGVGFNPEYIAIGSAVAEDTLLNRLQGVDTVENASMRMFNDQGQMTQAGNFEKPFVKSSMNKEIGNNINREWKLRTGGPDSVTDISNEQATVLGDAFLEMYYNVNKGAEGAELMTRVSPTGKTGEVQFKLTPLGIKQLAAGKKLRKRIFYRPEVEPYKTPPVREGMGKTPMSRFFIKAVKKIKGDRNIKEAMFNLSQIPHAVVPERLKLVTSIILPALAAAQAGADLTPQQEVYANILGFGQKKMNAFKAKEKMATKDKPYSAEQAMGELRNSIAQYYQALTKDRKGVNYLTWAMQGTGRIFVEQSGLDPTSSKLVRFALANPSPVVVKLNSRQEVNLRQMYAMHLVKGGDMLLPVERDKALSLATPQLVKWGKRLQEVLDGTMTGAQTDAIHGAVENKVGLKDSEFPQFNELSLDPEKDAALLEAIDRAGDDGLLYMDGLMDFAKYHERTVIGRKPHVTQFNAYIDGKTNGLAAMGMMLGDSKLAFLTGVLRVGNKKLLDVGDIRDELKDTLLNNINTVGLDYDIYTQAAGSLTTVASRVFSEKNLNKYTTMTFGYGRALQSIKGSINEFAAMLYEEALEAEAIEDAGRRATALNDRELVGFKDAYEAIQREDSDIRKLGSVLLEPYVSGLKQVVSEDSIRARSAMKAVAYLSALSDLPLIITGPTGMDLEMGGFVTKPNEPIKYSISTAEGKRLQREAQSYSADRRTAASATIIDKPNTDDVEIRVGMKAVNTAVVAPAQSTDAAVVVLTNTGVSMAKQIAASNGNPYSFPIYDAFKMDANGFDVIVKETNKNWMDVTMGWDVFGEYEAARERAAVTLKDKLSKMAPNAQVSLEVNEEFQMMGYLTTTVVKTMYIGATPVAFDSPQNLAYMLAEATDPGRGSKIEETNQKAEAMAMVIKKKMYTDVGFIFGSKTATPKQVQHFNKLLEQYLDTRQVLNTVKEDAKKGQVEILRLLKKYKGEVYQYFAH